MMKKLKLTLNGKEMLSKDQMKKISGGYYPCYCANGTIQNGGTDDECEANTVDCDDLCVVLCAQ